MGKVVFEPDCYLDGFDSPAGHSEELVSPIFKAPGDNQAQFHLVVYDSADVFQSQLLQYLLECRQMQEMVIPTWLASAAPELKGA